MNTKNPGALALKYANGMRIRFTSPIQYFFITFVLITLVSLIDTNFANEDSDFYEKDASGYLIDLGPELVKGYIQFFLLLLMPFASLIAHLLNFNRKKTFAETLCFSIYFFSQVALFLVIAQITLSTATFIGISSDKDYLAFLFFFIFCVLITIYATQSLRSFYGGNFIFCFIKALALLAGTTYILLGSLMLISILIWQDKGFGPISFI